MYLSMGQGVQKYKYNAKELDRTHGLDWYDYAARRESLILIMHQTGVQKYIWVDVYHGPFSCQFWRICSRNLRILRKNSLEILRILRKTLE